MKESFELSLYKSKEIKKIVFYIQAVWMRLDVFGVLVV